MSLTSTEKKENNVVELVIAVSAEELEKAAEQAYKRKGKTISVPGFRKGKAPRKIIERMYGDGIFLEDAVNDLYPQAYMDAVEEAGIEPVDKANVEFQDIEKEKGFTFTATVTVKPEVQVKDYKGIAAEKVIPVIGEEQVEEEIQRMRERNARIVTVEDRAAQLEDEAIIDFEGFKDDVPFEGGKGEAFSLTLGSGSFIDTFEDQIVGHKPGDEFDVNVTFPEEYHVEELKGQPALFKVKLLEIKGKELPELDDEFVKDVSEFDTLEELKADIRTKMQEDAEKRAQADLENALIDVVIENLEGDIPPVMFETRIDEMVQDFEYRLMAQGMNLQLYLQYTGMDMESFRKGFQEQSERQVKIRLALEKIAQLEGLEVTPEDIEAEYAKVAESYSMEVEQVKATLPEKDLTADIKTNKAIDLVRESAKVTEKVGDEGEEKKPKKAAAKKTKKDEAEAEGEEKPAPKKRATKKAAAEEEGEEKPAAKKRATKKAAAEEESKQDNA